MILYIEKSVFLERQSKIIREKNSGAKVLLIDNYKNIFDKQISGTQEKSLIIGKVNNAVLKAPLGYGFSGPGYFMKTSLNCIFKCDYCYLQGIFKNDISVIFVNYEYIKNQILDTVSQHKSNEIVWFYSSDYSDNLAIDGLTNFSQEFIPFFDTLPNARMEIRTKSNNINNLLELSVSKNVEIAFSLNPQEIIDLYEKGTSSLEQRFESIQKLLDKGWKVGLRFLPLLEVENFQEIYSYFIDLVIARIEIQKISSIFIGGLMFTYKDYNTILQKQPGLDLLYKLQKDNDGFYREQKDIRAWFYHTFSEKIHHKKCQICLDDSKILLS